MSVHIETPIASVLAQRSGQPVQLVNHMLSLAQENLVSQTPDLASAFVRTYNIPSNFMSWTHYRALMLYGATMITGAQDVAAELLKEDPEGVRTISDMLQGQVTHTNICMEAMKFEFPFWLVGKDLCEMLAHTESLADPNIKSEAALPFKALHFLTPAGVVTMPDGTHLTAIGVARMTLGDIVSHGFRVPEGIPMDEERLYVAGHTSDGSCYYSRLPIAEDGTVSDPSTQEFTMFLDDGTLETDQGNNDIGARCAEVAVGWALRFLIVMNAEPELIEAEAVTGRRKAKRDRKPMDFCSPRWLGRRVIRQAPEGGGGKHSSPLTHWRRGHMARRRCGKGRKDCRVVYIRPVLVNKPDEEASDE